ncbi:ATP-binding protein [Caldimonas tepidiphila]|uniref:sensor histidine kinase n=1 Tax=Caldimonas tepidiphila TaxID=2315841 RepID=UPI000E5C2CF5|nr:ATP-binding protein [Caldimonas tepidiphila]
MTLPIFLQRTHAAPAALLRYSIPAAAFLMLWLNLHWLAVIYETAPGSSAWYPARGLSLALLLIGGLRFAPVVAVASLVGGISYHLPDHPENLIANALLIAGGMSAAAWALRRLGVSAATRLRDAVALVLLSALAELVTAYGVVAVNVRSGLLAPQEYWGVAFQFFVGDYLGILIVVPVALHLAALWPPGELRRRLRLSPEKRSRLLQSGVELLLIAAISGELLWLGLSDGGYTASTLARWYLLLLPVSLAAIRFGPQGAAYTTLLLSAGIVAVVRATGNPVGQIDLQLLLMSLCIVSLLLSASGADRRRSLEAVAAMHRSQAEKARREAERARMSKARFLAATTHDLRPPFEAVRLGLETLALQKLPPEMDEVLRRTQNAARSLSRVLESVLDTARLEGEIRGVTPRDLALGPLFEQLAAETALAHPRGGAAVRARPTALHVIADPVLIERVLRNLLSNAVRACVPSGRVLLCARRRGLMVRIEVHDSGTGIAAERLPLIFDDFESGHAGGIGIGLSLVREISDQLGLGLKVRSLHGRGTVFCIELPLSTRSPEPGPRFREAAARVRDRVIALATRDAVRGEMITATLSDWGAAVVAGSEPEGVLQELRAIDSRADLFVVGDVSRPVEADRRDAGRIVELPASSGVAGRGRPLAADLEELLRVLR